MINNEENFLQEYNKQKTSLRAWGEYIKDYIIAELEKQKYHIECFLKTEVSVRIKEDRSILVKAFYRDKNYNNPLEDITDKVGIRFVVLLLDDIKIIEQIIEQNKEWNVSRDRDFERERSENPTIFEYQSVHYIIRNNKEITTKNTTIDKSTPCEVQIRTLLQHAYSELTHDTVYKPKQNVSPMIKRLVARSMALIETTDCIFKEVNDKMVEEKNTKSNNLLPVLKEEYAKIRIPEESNIIQDLVIDSFKDIIKNVKKEELLKFISENNPIIKDQINSKYSSQLLFRQPIILLLYYLIYKYPYEIIANWPLTEDLIKPIYVKLGISSEIQ
jgi:putative GTP pyrophosphokinase